MKEKEVFKITSESVACVGGNVARAGCRTVSVFITLLCQHNFTESWTTSGMPPSEFAENFSVCVHNDCQSG
jgi:hypothetical protein